MNSDQKNQYKELLEDTLKLENQKQAYQQKLIRCGGENRGNYEKRIRELEDVIISNMERINGLKTNK